MSNFNDFDLDLKRVAENGSEKGSSYSSLSSLTSVTTLPCSVTSLTVEISIDRCNSMGNPTTGMTTGCCKAGNGGDIAPQCV